MRPLAGAQLTIPVPGMYLLLTSIGDIRPRYAFVPSMRTSQACGCPWRAAVLGVQPFPVCGRFCMRPSTASVSIMHPFPASFLGVHPSTVLVCPQCPSPTYVLGVHRLSASIPGVLPSPVCGRLWREVIHSIRLWHVSLTGLLPWRPLVHGTSPSPVSISGACLWCVPTFGICLRYASVPALRMSPT